MRLLPLRTTAPFALLALVLAACGPRNINDVPVPKEPFIPFAPLQTYPEIAWLESVPEARARSAEDHKPLLLFVRAAWSQPTRLVLTTR